LGLKPSVFPMVFLLNPLARGILEAFAQDLIVLVLAVGGLCKCLFLGEEVTVSMQSADICKLAFEFSHLITRSLGIK